MQAGKLIAVAFLIAIALSGASHANDTLDYGKCKIYLIQNGTTIINNVTVPVISNLEVCAKDFPLISQNIILSKTAPLYMNPQYNLTVTISQDVFQEQITTIDNQKEIMQMNKTVADLQGVTISDLKSSIAGLNSNILAQNAQLRAEMENNTATLNGRIMDIENKYYKDKSSPSTMSIILVVIVLFVIVGFFALKKMGIVKLPADKIEDYETQEPKNKFSHLHKPTRDDDNLVEESDTIEAEKAIIKSRVEKHPVKKEKFDYSKHVRKLPRA